MNDSAVLPFAEAASYYRRGRPPYARETIPYLCDRFQLSSASRALDLGCGPGTIAVPLARHVGEVVAVDQDEAMLAEGRVAAGEAHRANIAWRCLRAEQIDEPAGAFDLVTLGQSFHWMDRDALLQRLTPMIRDGGGVALIAPSDRLRDESWQPIANAVLKRYFGPTARHPAMHPEPENTPSLLRSHTFADFDSRCFIADFERDVASVLAYVYSRSDWPRSRFGAKLAAFECQLCAALLEANPSGVWMERVETEIVVAKKRS